MSLIKKSIVGVLVTGTLATFVFGRDAMSYVRTFGCEVRDAVKSEIDVEFEVSRARGMVENLVPEIKESMSVIAEQRVEIGELQRSIQDKELSMRSEKDRILVLRGDLNSGESRFQYASRSYTRDAVERDLETRFTRFQTAEDALSRDRQILEARERALDANLQTLQEMLTQKEDLAVQIAQLDARLKTVKAAETVSSLDFDNSQLSRAKQLIKDLNRELDVKEALLDAEGEFIGLIPVELESEHETTDITSRIDAYFTAEDVVETDTIESDDAAEAVAIR